MDLLIGNQGYGSVATRLLNNDMKTNALRTNATLRVREWVQMDEVLVKEAIPPMKAVNYLRSKGLTYNVGNSLGKTVLEYETVSEMGDAAVSMDVEDTGGNDGTKFNPTQIPLPIIHKSWFLNARQLAASRDKGESLDTIQVTMTGRKIGEMLEHLTLFGHPSFSFGTTKIYGMLTAPNRIKQTATKKWNAADTTAQDIKDDILKAIQALQDNNFYGPYGVFVSSNCSTKFSDDYEQYYAKTLAARVREIEGIDDVLFVPFMNPKAGFNAVVFQLAPDVVRIVEGLPLQNVQWEEQGNMRFHFKGMMIATPDIRSTYSGKCGIVHIS